MSGSLGGRQLDRTNGLGLPVAAPTRSVPVPQQTTEEVPVSRSARNRRQFLRSTAAVAAGALVPYFATPSAAAEKKIKLFMHWDMEGTSGIFQRDQTW